MIYRKYWVSMTDNFMSGWGHAEGRINKYVIECDTLEQAEQLKAHADTRDEMSYVNLRVTKPNYNVSTHLTTWKHYSDMGDVWIARPQAKTELEQRYNGWANYETWNVGLWIDNEEILYTHNQKLMSEASDKKAYHQEFKRFAMVNLYRYDIDTCIKVNWDELVNSNWDEYQQETQLRLEGK